MNVKHEKPSYYAIIPASVRYDKRLKPAERLLYGEISALTNKYGYCNASNGYFADLYEVGKTTVSHWIAKLINYGYLYVDTIMDGKQIVERRLYLSDQNATPIAQKSNTPIAQKSNTPIAQKSNTPIAQKSKGNNTSINNTSINTEILNITEDLTFVHSENFGEKIEEIHVAGVDSDMAVNQSSVVSDETTPDPLGVSQSKSTKQAEQKAERVEKQFLAVVEVYNRVFANCPAVSKVNLKAKAANQNRKKLIHAAWAIAKDRVLTSWVDEQGLIDGEKPSAKHILEWFEAFFAERLEDPFINGQQQRSKGHENWKADFEYLLKKTNVEKWVYEND